MEISEKQLEAINIMVPKLDKRQASAIVATLCAILPKDPGVKTQDQHHTRSEYQFEEELHWRGELEEFLDEEVI